MPRSSNGFMTHDVEQDYTESRPKVSIPHYTAEHEVQPMDERTPLLPSSSGVLERGHTFSGLTSPRVADLSRNQSMTASLRMRKTPRGTGTRAHSYTTSPLLYTRTSRLRTPKLDQSGMLDSIYVDHREWYDQFSSIDWVHESIANGHRKLQLRHLKGWRGRLRLWFDTIQGWILVLLIGILTACVAYLINMSEATIFDLKRGFCGDRPWLSRTECCLGPTSCARWKTWSEILHHEKIGSVWIDYFAFVLICVICALLSCFITLLSKTVAPSHVAATFDENLGARVHDNDKNHELYSIRRLNEDLLPPSIYYSAAGSGVAEVKVILSGFVLHGYLGARTLVLKIAALILSASSGMSLGKEGPYVHIATCISNVACRMFSKYRVSGDKKREVLSSGASSGVAVAFGSPLGGVLFGLEEVAYYFPPKTLFRTFFCCIVAALGLKFLNPYGTNKIVLFQVTYTTDWRFFELFWFALLGMLGGLLGALFIKASKWWAYNFRKLSIIKSHPVWEVLLVALLTGIASFWNRYTRLSVAELLAELASPCTEGTMTGLCPASEDIPSVIGYLAMAFVIKALLTVITFGIKVPAGIYVPSMVVGGLMGRIIGHFVQWLVYQFPNNWLFGFCSNSSSGATEECVTPGVYALAAAGATMCGVTRLSITLAVILFELTGSLDHVLPFSLAVLFAKWTADAVEPRSIYDLLTDMNSYPFLDNKHSPLFESELGDILPGFQQDRLIDITISPWVKASELRIKLNTLQNAGELDGGLPIIKDRILKGLIPAPDLEIALDKIETPETSTLCLLSSQDPQSTWLDYGHGSTESLLAMDTDEDAEQHAHTADFTPFVDISPLALDIKSSMELVHQCFVKLGIRYICVVSDGQYRGMVHKKSFVKYTKTLEGDK